MANIFDQYNMDYTASLNNALRGAQVLQNANTPIPDGKYQAKITDMRITPSKKYQDELQLDLALQIISEPCQGRYCHRYYSIVPEFIERLKTDMHVLGLDLDDDITVLGEEDVAEAMCGRIVDIQIKNKHSRTTGKDYMNVYILRLVALGEFSEVEQDDDNPFE